MDELDDRQMHKVVTKEWRKTERLSVKALKQIKILYSVLAAEIIQWPGSVVPLTMFDTNTFEHVFRYFFADAHFYEEKSESENMLISILKKVQS